MGKLGNLRRISGYAPRLYVGQRTAADGELRIAGLGPPENQVTRYMEGLGEGLQKYDDLSGREGLEQLDRVTSDLHNIVSVVLLIAFGNTRVILGGDADKESWRLICEDTRRMHHGDSLKAHLIKVSHHGSETAFCHEAWQQHEYPHSIITPFRNTLPKTEMVDAIKSYSEETYSTVDPIGRSHPWRVNSWRFRMPERGLTPFTAQPGDRVGQSFLFDRQGNLVEEEAIRFRDCIS